MTHFHCCDLSRIPRSYRARHLAVLPLEKEECKDEQLSSTLSFMGLCPGARHWTLNEEVTALQGAEYFSSLGGTKCPIMMCKDSKELGNSQDPFDSVLWPKPEIIKCGTRLMVFSCSGTLRNGGGANQTAVFWWHPLGRNSPNQQFWHPFFPFISHSVVLLILLLFIINNNLMLLLDFLWTFSLLFSLPLLN